MSDVTGILAAIEEGDQLASEKLLPLVYDELRRLAAAKMAREKPGQTLQATALVHEAYVRLVNVEEAQQWNSREHFFAAAAEAMRRILVENARRRGSQKRGGDCQRIELSVIAERESPEAVDLLDLDEALKKLETRHPAPRRRSSRRGGSPRQAPRGSARKRKTRRTRKEREPRQHVAFEA